MPLVEDIVPRSRGLQAEMYSIFATSVVVRLARMPVSVTPRPAIIPVPVVSTRPIATPFPDSAYPYRCPAGDSSDLFILISISDGCEMSSHCPSTFVVPLPSIMLMSKQVFSPIRIQDGFTCRCRVFFVNGLAAVTIPSDVSVRLNCTCGAKLRHFHCVAFYVPLHISC